MEENHCRKCTHTHRDERVRSGLSLQGTIDVWKLINGGGGWHHPVHVHLEDAYIIKRENGRADAANAQCKQWAKDPRSGLDPTVELRSLYLYLHEFV